MNGTYFKRSPVYKITLLIFCSFSQSNKDSIFASTVDCCPCLILLSKDAILGQKVKPTGISILVRRLQEANIEIGDDQTVIFIKIHSRA
jgi:hypothetical protein